MKSDGLEGEELAREDIPAIVAHDIKNPLQCIQGYAALISRGKSGAAEMRQMADRILSCSLRIEGIVNDLSRMRGDDAPALALEPKPVILTDVVREVAESFEAKCRDKGIALSFASESRPIEAWADARRIQQAVANLLGNAAAHVPPGGTILVSVCDHATEVVISVTDSGSGVAPEHRDRLFEKGYQVRDGRHGSLGLGLYIVKLIAREHGGTAWLRTGGPDQGTTFGLTLPRAGPSIIGGRPARPMMPWRRLTFRALVPGATSVSGLALLAISLLALTFGATLLLREPRRESERRSSLASPLAGGTDGAPIRDAAASWAPRAARGAADAGGMPREEGRLGALLPMATDQIAAATVRGNRAIADRVQRLDLSPASPGLRETLKSVPEKLAGATAAVETTLGLVRREREDFRRDGDMRKAKDTIVLALLDGSAGTTAMTDILPHVTELAALRRSFSDADLAVMGMRMCFFNLLRARSEMMKEVQALAIEVNRAAGPGGTRVLEDETLRLLDYPAGLRKYRPDWEAFDHSMANRVSMAPAPFREQAARIRASAVYGWPDSL